MSCLHNLHFRFLAWFMARDGGEYASFIEARKRHLLGNLSGTLVEIGSGAGPNLRYLPKGVRIVGVEPNPFMHKHFLQQARMAGQTVKLVQGRGEALPFPDESVDTVLSTLVLCSVGRLDVVLSEALRILKPGGKFLFIEHVAADEGTWLRRLQGWIRPAWSRIGDGCQPDRATELEIMKAGFRRVDIEQFKVPLPVFSPHIAGIAEK